MFFPQFSCFFIFSIAEFEIRLLGALATTRAAEFLSKVNKAKTNLNLAKLETLEDLEENRSTVDSALIPLSPWEAFYSEDMVYSVEEGLDVCLLQISWFGMTFFSGLAATTRDSFIRCTYKSKAVL